MDREGRVYLDLSPDIREILAGEEITVQGILEEAGIEAEVRHDTLPPEHLGERTRDLVPVIMAGSVAVVSLAAAAAMITSAISKFLEAKAARPRYIEYLEEKPVLDSQGNPVPDRDGKVQTIRVPVHRFVELKNLSTESFSLEATLEKGIIVKMESGKTL